MTSDMPKRKRGRPSKQDSQDLHAKILDSAIFLFAENSFEAITMKDIAQRSGVASSLVHHHFGTREGLRKACRDHIIEQISKTLAAHEAQALGDAPTDLLDLFGQLLRSSLGNRSHLMRFLAKTFSENHPDSRQLFSQYFDLFHGMIARYAKAGKLRDDIDPKWIAIQAIYMQLGTAFLYDQMHHKLNACPYSAETSEQRTNAFIEIAKSGLLHESNT